MKSFLRECGKHAFYLALGITALTVFHHVRHDLARPQREPTVDELVLWNADDVVRAEQRSIVFRAPVAYALPQTPIGRRIATIRYVMDCRDGEHHALPCELESDFAPVEGRSDVTLVSASLR